MPLSTTGVFIFIVTIILLSYITILIIAFLIEKWNTEYERDRRVIPLNRIFRLIQLRHQFYQVELDKHYQKQQKVIEQIKNL